MQQAEVEKIITKYQKPIFGFALKRCRNEHDDEDLLQEIVFRAYTLLARDDINDALGVSPVYEESEAEYLEEYGLLTKHGDKYLCNILLVEPTDDLVRLHDKCTEKPRKISQTNAMMS